MLRSIERWTGPLFGVGAVLFAFLNLAGSVLFGVSAVSALVLRSGTDVSLRWASIGTFLGALCFLVAAWLFGWPRGVAR